MAGVLVCAVPLPAGYRPGDILAFHRRDAQALSERADEAGFSKAMLWGGKPACLSIRFTAAGVRVRLALDGRAPAGSRARLENMARRMLGLTQGVEAFEQAYREHPVIGALLARQAGLRVPVAATPFEALTWAITGQQVSVAAAVSIRRRFIGSIGKPHSSGLVCYPNPEQIAALSPEALREAGFSTAKAATLSALSRLVADGGLPLDDWLDAPPITEIRDRLLGIRGIGPWTADYTLLRGFGWMDGSLHGDVAVRRALQLLTAAPDKIGEKAAQQWLSAFSPWRALVAAHLWASLSNTAY